MNNIRHGVSSKKIPVECLLNNFIDTEVLSSYKALIFIDSLFFNSKFTITNNFITPNSMKSQLKSIIGVAFQITLHIYRFFYLTDTFKDFINSNVVSFLLCVGEMTYVVATVLIYVINMIQSKNNVLIMIKIQQALRAVNSETNNITKHHKLWNWMSIIAIFSIYGIYASGSVFGSCTLGKGLYSWIGILTSFADLIFDMNVIYVTRTVDFIGKILVLWNDKMAANKQAKLAALQEKTVNKGTATKALFQAHMNLIKAFLLCKSIFQFTVRCVYLLSLILQNTFI